MGRLRVRGRPNMELCVLLRCAGWNLSRAIAALKKRGKADFRGLCGHLLGLFGHLEWTHRQGRANRIALLLFSCLRPRFASYKVA